MMNDGQCKFCGKMYYEGSHSCNASESTKAHWWKGLNRCPMQKRNHQTEGELIDTGFDMINPYGDDN